jgi:small subunit ribosomal protein S8
MMTDPISDMLTRLRNAFAVKKRDVVLPYSNVKFAIAKILEREGFVSAVEKVTQGSRAELRIALAYRDGAPALTEVRRVSTPGHRVYAKTADLPRVKSDIGIAIVSTPNGLMTNKEARSRKLGGEVICEVF